jgi:primase-polymerase (primpol)-like protein
MEFLENGSPDEVKNALNIPKNARKIPIRIRRKRKSQRNTSPTKAKVASSTQENGSKVVKLKQCRLVNRLSSIPSKHRENGPQGNL